MNCCAACFGDPYLQREVIPERNSGIGTCSYCGTSDQTLTTPASLREDFELVTGVYIQAEDGKFLDEWLHEDWALFDKDRMDMAHVKELLADILGDEEVVRKRFVPSDMCLSDTLDRWSNFCTELMHENRFFPTTNINLERLAELLDYLILPVTELSTKWYRARIQDGSEPFTTAQMGAPPKQRAGHGRANPAGIPYLYIASNDTTAVSEIRPHTGEMASVAEFSLPAERDLSIVDLRWPRVTVSPFMFSSENEVALLRGDIGFLEHLGSELTRPVLPQAAAIDYIPSQYLCEYIKHCGFDGVMYLSSVGDGDNLALFDPDLANIGSISSLKVERVTVELSQVS